MVKKYELVGNVRRGTAARELEKEIHVSEEIVYHIKFGLRTSSFFCFFAGTNVQEEKIPCQNNVIFATVYRVAMLCECPTICSHKNLVYNFLKMRTMLFFTFFSGPAGQNFNVFIRKSGQNLRTKNCLNILKVRISSSTLLF